MGGDKHLLTIAELTDAQKAMVQQVREKFPDFSEGDILGYLQYRNWDVAQAELQMHTTQGYRESYAPTIADIAPFMLSAPGCAGPDGCQVLLEDMKGGVLCDNEGRMIVLSIGMCHGTTAEMLEQQAYVCRRVREYEEPGKIQRICVIMEVKPREGCSRTTFRFPDKGTKQMMDIQKQHYPSSQYGAATHVCGVPRTFQWAFALCRPFMSKESYEALILRTDYTHLPKHLPKSSILKEWGGEVEWDLGKYVEWRAKEEGVTLDPANVRRFDPTASQDEAMTDMTESFKSISAAALQKWDPAPAKMGPVEKQGSGQGWFATTKWKTKLLSAGPPGFACYFDSDKISEANTATRAIALFGAFIEEDIQGAGGKKNAFTLVTPQRTYKFAAADKAGAEAWVAALRGGIQEATVQHAESHNMLKEMAPTPSQGNGSTAKRAEVGSSTVLEGPMADMMKAPAEATN